MGPETHSILMNIEARLATVERQFAEQRFTLDGRLLEVERHFADLERRLDFMATSPPQGGRQCAGSGEAWEDNDDDSPAAFCGVHSDHYLCALPPQPSHARKSHEARLSAAHTAWSLSYRVKDSCWDASIFIGTNFLDARTNVGLLLSLILNFTIQTLFTCITWEQFRESVYNEALLNQIRKWRYDAHSYSYSASTSHMSLVTRVCHGDSTLSYATDKEHWAMELQGWISGHNYMLCVLALLLWIFTICNEFHDACLFLLSVIGVPFSSQTRIAASGNQVKMEALSYCGLGLGVGVAFLRLAIAGMLLYVGSIWLINTDSPEELLLNAVALNFVLQCDELIYAVFCPAKARAFITILEPLPLRRAHRTTFDVLWCSRWFLLPVCVMSLIYFQMTPNQEMKIKSRELMCRGSQDFVYDFDPLGRMIYMRTPEFGQKRSKEHRGKVVHHLIMNSTVEGQSAVEMERSEFLSARKMTLLEFTRFWTCKDQPEQLKYAYSVIGIDSLRSCIDAQHHCSGANKFVRAVCPQTCGCDDPLSGILRFDDGCPAKGCLASAVRVETLNRLPCMDRPVFRLNTTHGWGNFLRELSIWLRGDWEYSQAWVNERLGLLRRLGCGALDNAKVLDVGIEKLCGPLAAVCPVACKCGKVRSVGRTWFCPKQCGQPSTAEEDLR